MPQLPAKAVIDKGLCDLGIVHRTKFDVHPDMDFGYTDKRLFRSVCELWLESDKLIEEGTVNCVECLAAPPGCR